MELPALAVRRVVLPPRRSGSGLPAWLGSVPDSGPPPPAILCLRRLAAPVPAERFAPPLARAWGGALASGIAAGWRDAARPAAGPVPAGAGAVWFADRAELLACLARDARNGEATARWWWRTLRLGTTPAAVAAALVATPAALPAVFGHLAKAGEAAAVTAWFPADATMAIATALAEHFAVPIPTTSVAPRIRPAWRRFATGVRAEWRQAVPELGSAGLTPWSARLLGLALVLHRRPAASVAAARALWAVDGRTVDDADALSPPPRPLKPSRAATASEPPGPDIIRQAARATRTAHQPAVMRGAPWRRRHHDAPTGSPLPFSNPVPASRFDRGDLPPAPRPPEPDAGVLARDRATRHGGLFFLLNPLLELGLYGDFSAPRRPGLPVSPWDLLALFGDAATGGRIRREPIWRLLADLAGRRPGVAPGGGWRPIGWDAPPAWLAGLPVAGPWRMTPPSRRGRLRLLHPSGLLALDQPAAAARLALARRRPRQRPHHGGVPPGAVIDLPTWCATLATVLEARLGVALRRPAAGTLPWLIARPATLRRTPGTLNATFDLGAHPLAIRRAGLDRDPGWIPAAGCDIRFHFVLQGEA